MALSLTRSPKQYYRIIKRVPRAWREIDRRYLVKILKEFREERLVRWEEDDNGMVKITISEAGRRRLLAFDFDKLQIKKPGRWDGTWRAVLYDIPEKNKRARDALRRKLKELGFYEWQKSVWVHPFPCRDEIDFIVKVFNLRPYVRYIEFLHPTNEAELKLRFSLT